MLTREQRLDRLDDLIQRGMLIRKAWTADKRVCLLAALSPEAGREESAHACPADVLPPWFACLTPHIDDGTSKAYWPEMVREYGRVVRRAAVLTPEDWRRLDFASRAIALRVALPHASLAKPILERVLAMCEREAKGDRVLVDEWRAAARPAVVTAAAAAATPAPPATRAAAAAALAVLADADAAMFADMFADADAIATRAAVAAVLAVYYARNSDRAATADAAADAAAAWDAIAKGILAAIDARCAEREASC